jgi:hypothetical protein
MEKLQRTYFYAAVLLVLSVFAVEGGGFDKRFRWGENYKFSCLNLLVKTTTKNSVKVENV